MDSITHNSDLQTVVRNSLQKSAFIPVSKEPNPKGAGPCPLCGKTDWCKVAPDGTVICPRTDFAPMGWKLIKKTVSDHGIFKPESTLTDRADRAKKIVPNPRPAPTPKPAPVPGKIKLLKLPSPAVDCPQPHTPTFMPDGVPSHATQVTYEYGEGKRIDRYEWEDPESPKGRSKTHRQSHVNSKGEVIWQKGDAPWKMYRSSEIVNTFISAMAEGGLSEGKAIGILVLEGEANVELARSIGLAAITWQGSCWSDSDIDVGLADFASFQTPNSIPVVVQMRDNDAEGIKKAETVRSGCAKRGIPYVLINPVDIYPEIPDKGDIKEILEAMPIPEFIRRLEEQIHAVADSAHSDSAPVSGSDILRDVVDCEPVGDRKRKADLPDANATASEIAERYRDKLAWESEYQLWRHYGAKNDGVWDETTPESVRGLIHAHLRALPDSPGFSAGYVSSVLTILQSDLEVRDWNEQDGLIPLRDGMLDRDTKELKPHAPGYRFTWQLPYRWSDRSIGCQPIEEFLLKITGDKEIAEVLLAFLSAIVTRRADLQRYLELIGGGGTGKSTFMALATALAGADNTVSSQLKLLQGNQFETAKFYRKLLVLFPDSERWQGEVSVLKQLTGQDPIRYERKGVQQCRDYKYEGMVILSANEPSESSDRTSGQERRKLTIGLDNRLPEYEGRNLTKEFEPYLPGLLARVLEISPDRVAQLVKFSDRNVPALVKKKWEQMTETNPIAAWLDECCVLVPGVKTYVGTNCPDKINEWLYTSFCAYQNTTGGSKALHVRRFSTNLQDLLEKQLGADVKKGKDRRGAFFQGVGLRCVHDTSGINYPTPITGRTFDGLVMDGDGCVMVETIGSDGCDGYDGYFKSQEKREKNPPSRWEQPDLPFSEILNPLDSQEYPSHPSHPSLPGVPAITSLSPDPSQVSDEDKSSDTCDAIAKEIAAGVPEALRTNSHHKVLEIEKYLVEAIGEGKTTREAFKRCFNSPNQYAMYEELLSKSGGAVSMPMTSSSEIGLNDRVEIVGSNIKHYNGVTGKVINISSTASGGTLDFTVEFDTPVRNADFCDFPAREVRKLG
jgi:putative DNA primase/helicase